MATALVAAIPIMGIFVYMRAEIFPIRKSLHDRQNAVHLTVLTQIDLKDQKFDVISY